MKIRFVALTVLFAWMLAACGGDKPPMVPDPDTTQADAGASD